MRSRYSRLAMSQTLCMDMASGSGSSGWEVAPVSMGFRVPELPRLSVPTFSMKISSRVGSMTSKREMRVPRLTASASSGWASGLRPPGEWSFISAFPL